MNEFLNDEPEELEPLDEDEFTPDTSVLGIECVEIASRNYEKSVFPCFILDSPLQFVWKNIRFTERMLEVSAERSNLITYFRDSFDDATRNELFADLRSPEKGFSWRGVVQLYDRDRPTLVAHLLIGPIIPKNASPSDLPKAYLGIVDDISGYQRDLVRATFSSLLEASRLKDNDTGHHVSRVNEYSRILAEAVARTQAHGEVDYEFIDTISFVAAMHDVGKIGTPDDILNKDGPLDSWEWDVMREHTKNGAYILATYPTPMARQIALFHHEKWDGSGYPYGIAGDMIPLAARIVMFADVYDALRMPRAYKPAFPHEKACEEIETEFGTHFDPDLGKLFLEYVDRMNDIYERLKDA